MKSRTVKKAPARSPKTTKTKKPVKASSTPPKPKAGSTRPAKPTTGGADKVSLSRESGETDKPSSRIENIAKGLKESPNPHSGDPSKTDTKPGRLTPQEQAEWKKKLGEKTLQPGLRNVDSVGHLQDFLNQREDKGLEIDKNYGGQTEAAVREAQIRAGLKPTGVFDSKTRDALLAAEKKVKEPEKPVAVGKGTEAAKARIQDILAREHKFFGGQTIEEKVGRFGTKGTITKHGTREDKKGVYKRVGEYWKTVGENLDGKDRDSPWSAAFISHVHKEAGVGPQFKKSIRHSTYIKDAIVAKNAGNTNAAYWGHRTTKRAPAVGDLVAYARQRGVNYDRQPNSYKSHTDIVTKVGKGYIEVIGGNVKHSVSKRRIPTDENGLLLDKKKYFAVLTPQNLGQ